MKPLNRFYTHIHLPTKTVKFGITSQNVSDRLKYECENWDRQKEDYKILYDIETKDCWRIENDCVKMLKAKYSNYKLLSDNGKKIYSERFYYHRPIMRDIKKIVKSYA